MFEITEQKNSSAIFSVVYPDPLDRFVIAADSLRTSIAMPSYRVAQLIKKGSANVWEAFVDNN